jgi:RNA polymerase sigma factor (sigma-70 family)
MTAFLNNTSYNDNWLIDQSILGNQNAYTQLMRKHERLVRATISRYIPGDDEADEAFQDTFLRAFQALADFRRESKLSSWLVKIASSVAINRVRSKRYRHVMNERNEIEERSDLVIRPEGAQQIEKQETKFWLRRAINLLPQNDSEVIEQFYFEERSIDEICKLNGLTESNVKSRLSRARQRLRSIIEDKFGRELMN